MGIGAANGNFGSGTTEKCPTISAESRINLVRILQSALYVNGFKGTTNGVYDAGTVANFNLLLACLKPVWRVCRQ